MFFSNFGGMRLKSEYIFLPCNSNLFKQRGHYQGIIYDIWHKGCIKDVDEVLHLKLMTF